MVWSHSDTVKIGTCSLVAFDLMYAVVRAYERILTRVRSALRLCGTHNPHKLLMHDVSLAWPIG